MSKRLQRAILEHLKGDDVIRILKNHVWKRALGSSTAIFFAAMLVHAPFAPPAHAQQKLAQTGFNFMSVGTDARATSMGESFTTIEGSSTALLYNPAGLAALSSFMDLSINRLDWIADIRYFSGTVAVAPFEGRYGVVGVSFVNVDYGEFKFTRVAQNENGYEDLEGWPNPGAYMIGLGYGKELSTQFVVGGQVKYAYQDLGKSTVPLYKQVLDDFGRPKTDTTYEVRDYSVGTLAFDFGTIYRTGLKSLAFGVAVNNFSREIRYERESFQLPLSFKIGISMNLMDLLPELQEHHVLFVSVDAAHPRSYPEFLNIGGEYVFRNTLALRMGYISNHPDYDLTAGIGVRKFGVAVDYSYTPHKVFSDLQRISVRFSF